MKNNKTKLVILGGFLGSGKTTLMMELSRLLKEQGKKVAVITNDQGGYLVDTAFSSNLGIPSVEVTAGCFCCNFPDLISNIQTLAEEHSPDFIIAEAVGSCTDLNSTVLLPLKKYHGDLVDLAAYFVLVDGSRVIDEYRKMDLVHPASPKEVLVSHQIAEASLLVLSKSDFFVDDERDEALEYIRAVNSEASIITVSSRERENLESLLSIVLRSEPVEVTKTVPLDYEIYAEAEAEYGWYNGQWKYHFSENRDPESLGREMMDYLKRSIPGEIAHGKILLSQGSDSVKISLAGGRIESDISGTPNLLKEADVTLNIRAASDPAEITAAVDSLLEDYHQRNIARIDSYTYSSLIPAPPKPTYRLEVS